MRSIIVSAACCLAAINDLAWSNTPRQYPAVDHHIATTQRREAFSIE
jgi:hypothetical protein